MHRTHAGHGSIWPAETSGKPVEARASDQSTLTPERIAELRGLAEKATPGPWERVDNAAYALNDEGTNRMYLNVFGGYEIQRRNGISVRTAGAEITANAALIAAMRNALPALLDAAERVATLELERDEAKMQIVRLCGDIDGALHHEEADEIPPSPDEIVRRALNSRERGDDAEEARDEALSLASRAREDALREAAGIAECALTIAHLPGMSGVQAFGHAQAIIAQRILALIDKPKGGDRD